LTLTPNRPEMLVCREAADNGRVPARKFQPFVRKDLRKMTEYGDE
jgi:hypothetical protein